MGVKHFIKIILVLLITNNCHCQSNSHNNNLAFQEYVKAIPTIDVPFSISCKKNVTPIKTSIADSLIRKYGISGAYIYGKLTTTKPFTAIVYFVVADEYIPVLKTSDNFGNAIDTLTLLQNCGGNDVCYYGNSFAEITSHLYITIKDTVRICRIDTLDQIIPGSEKIETQNRRLIVNDKGRIMDR